MRLQSTVKVSKAKGHATDAMVAGGRDRREDKEGNDAADIAADFGRLRQPEVVNDARRHLLRAKQEWYPRMLVLHRFWLQFPGRRSIMMMSAPSSTFHPSVLKAFRCFSGGPRTRRYVCAGARCSTATSV